MGLWTAPRLKPLPLNYLVTRNPSGTHRNAVYFCTDGKLPPTEVLAYVVRRWSLEVTLAELRAHLGMETQRQWSDLAISRTTPVLMGLFSVVSVLAVHWHERGELAVGGSAWESPADSDRLELPKPLWEAVIQALSRAAKGQSPVSPCQRKSPASFSS